MSKSIVSVLALCISLASPASADTKVGVLLPLSGDFSYFGDEVRGGMTVALDELNNSGIKLPQFIFDDEKCLAREAVSAYRRLVDEQKVSFVIGPACSASIQSVAPIAKRTSVPVLYLLDSGESVSKLPDPLYSLGFDPSQMARTLADDLFHRNIRDVAVISEEEEYAVLIAKAFEEKWENLGGKVVISESVPVKSPDLRTTIFKILSRKPQAIFYSSAYEAGNFLKQLRTIDAEIPVYGNDTMCISETIEAAGPAAEKARCANVILDETADRIKVFRKAVENVSKKSPKSLFYSALGYDAVYLTLREMKLNVPTNKTLLGVEHRNSVGVYDIKPTVLEARSAKLLPVE